MGSKQRRKSKTSRRQPTPAKPLSAANDQEPTQPSVSEDIVKDDASEVQQQPQEQRSSPADGVNEETTPQGKTAAPPLESEQLLPVKEAKQLLELFVISLLAANASPQGALLERRSEAFSLSELENLLVQQLDEADFLDLRSRIKLALRRVCQDSSGAIDASVLIELVGAASFRVEILEFQVRQAFLDRSSSKSRAKIHVQRVVAKLSASSMQDSATISSANFEAMLEEKLGVSTGSSLLSRVIFARIVSLPFKHPLPKRMQCRKDAFFAALESFVADKPLSLDSVEGQLRHLVSNNADLHASFKALDTDDSGAISVGEIVAFLQREAHMHYPRDVIATFIKRFDTDGDGTLSVEEFVAFVSPKQFGIQVLTPFGMFYHAADRHEPMKDVVAKIKTRMFWMQHNDLFATSTQPVYKPPLKLKVSDQFILTHHYGKLRLRFKDHDPIASVLENGEMVVLVMEPNAQTKKSEGDGRLSDFEYRLRPNIKRSIPPLMSWTMDESQDQVAPSRSSVEVKKSLLHSRKGPHRLNDGDRHSMRTSQRSDDDAMSVGSTRSLASNRSTKSSITTKPAMIQTKAKGISRPTVKQNTQHPTATQRQDPTTEVEELSVTSVPDNEPLASVVETPPCSSETPREYEYYDGDSSPDEDRDADDTEGESRNNFEEFSQGDECGPPQERPGGETVDCDEEEPPPAYDS